MTSARTSPVHARSAMELTLMEQFKSYAERCRTPKQFRDLVKQLQALISVSKLHLRMGILRRP